MRLLIFSLLLVAGPCLARKYYGWDDIKVSTEQTGLFWTHCPEDYEMLFEHGYSCMRFEVPLDYNDRGAGSTTIAFMKKASRIPQEQPPELVVILGGPGRSGIEDMVSGRVPSRHVLGRKHDIITFDPRGIGHSGPNIDCFNGDVIASYQASSGEYTFSSSSRKSIFRKAGAWGDLCKENLNNSARYIGTPAVAQDLLNYFERRKMEARPRSGVSADINFYGAGYGAVVGATFASMYPQRIGRMVLDSPTTEDYYKSVQRHASADQNEAARQFFIQCSNAGPELCQFWGATPEIIEARYQKLLKKMTDHQLHVPFIRAPLDTPLNITADSIRAQMLKATYQGHITFRQFSKQLADLEEDDYRSWDLTSMKVPNCAKCTPDDWEYLHETFQNPVSQGWNQWAAYAISCSDMASNGRLTLLEFDRLMRGSHLRSPYTGIQSGDMAYCSRWPLTPPVSQQFNRPFGGNTKVPIYIIANTHDPTTAISEARDVQKRFPRSYLAEQKIVAHGAASWGKCINLKVENYFYKNRLPLYSENGDSICNLGKSSLHSQE